MSQCRHMDWSQTNDEPVQTHGLKPDQWWASTDTWTEARPMMSQYRHMDWSQTNDEPVQTHGLKPDQWWASTDTWTEAGNIALVKFLSLATPELPAQPVAKILSNDDSSILSLCFTRPRYRFQCHLVFSQVMIYDKHQKFSNPRRIIIQPVVRVDPIKE